MDRRDFLRMTGAGTSALWLSRMPRAAAVEGSEAFDTLVPPDKNLDPDWVKSLFARGEPESYRGKELDLIGMPVGGICAGQVYLGGDGRLWHWDIFNRHIPGSEEHYAQPVPPSSPFEQGFALHVNGERRPLDHTGFSDIRFRGGYPIGRVEYRDLALPLEVTLEAFSPFIPLNAEDSSLPATVMQFMVKNTSDKPVEAAVVGALENAVALDHRNVGGVRRNRIVSGGEWTFLECSAESGSAPAAANEPDIVFEDWRGETYEGWTAEGTAFGSGPVERSALLFYQGDTGDYTGRFVNSHTAAPGTNLVEKDARTGRLTSRPFVIGRDFIHFRIGGGRHPGKTGLNLLVDGKIVRTATGHDDTALVLRGFTVREFRGRRGVLEIVDEESGGWGNIGIGPITFSNEAPEGGAFRELSDYGTMGLTLLGDPAEIAHAGAVDTGAPLHADPKPAAERTESAVPLEQHLFGELGRTLKLAAGQSDVVTFVLTWHFPNLALKGARDRGRRYATRFDSALVVAKYVAAQFPRLAAETRAWRDTWYDSTLPWWFLDRTFLNASILATSTCHWFDNGRFYGWEGVNMGPGTCTSVWYYAQAVARLFPGLERTVREMQDFTDGIGFDPATGGIFTRGEYGGDFVLDGQAGNVLRAWREHRMSADQAFLKRTWAKTKKALEWLIREDGDDDGIIDGRQSTTLDTGLWWGAMSWTSSLYGAALHAGAAMAEEMGEAAYADRVRAIADRGARAIVDRLWNGEYFIHKPDRSQPTSFVIGNGCHIDQVYGQVWADQVGLGRILPARHTRSALEAIWKYNFTPDVGPYRRRHPAGRWYAMPGEGGVIMTTWPRGDREAPKVVQGGMAVGMGYLNECMTGFEHQVAGHMIGEGLVMEGLAIERTIHDRYHPSRRNPWNEVEYGDHYSRAMASYGVFLAACGFEYHGPKGHIGFAPKLSPENFKAAFTAAEGWGRFAQTVNDGRLRARLTVHHGRLRVRTIALAAPDQAPASVTVTADGQPTDSRFEVNDGRLVVSLAADNVLNVGGTLDIAVE